MTTGIVVLESKILQEQWKREKERGADAGWFTVNWKLIISPNSQSDRRYKGKETFTCISWVSNGRLVLSPGVSPTQRVSFSSFKSKCNQVSLVLLFSHPLDKSSSIIQINYCGEHRAHVHRASKVSFFFSLLHHFFLSPLSLCTMLLVNSHIHSSLCTTGWVWISVLVSTTLLLVCVVMSINT